MMERVDPDFTAYVVARWPALVRSAVLLGAHHAQAQDIAEETLARCWTEWSRIGQTDRDVEVYRMLLTVLDRYLDDPHQVPERGVVTDPTATEPEQAIEQRRVLEQSLAGLPPEQRVPVVLRGSAELDDVQLGEVLGGLPPEPRDGADWWTVEAFREAGTAIPVGQPPVQRVVARARARRRRLMLWTVGVAAGLALVIGIATWFGTRPPADPELPEGQVQQQANPANLPWYANGVLHLSEVTVDLDGVVAVAQVPDGVVSTDRSGRVLLVAADGELSLLGRTAPGSRIATSLERGWVAWVDEESGELVVHNVINDDEIARLRVAPGDQPVAIDQDSVYYRGDSGDWAWQVPDGEPVRLVQADLIGQVFGGQLLDVSSAVRAQRLERGIRITQPLVDVDIQVPGEHATLSPDGRHVLTWVGGETPRNFRVFATSSGEEEAVGLANSDLPVAAAFGPDSSISFVVAYRPNEEGRDEFMRRSASGPRLLKTCELSGIGELEPCETVTQFSLSSGPPVLPG